VTWGEIHDVIDELPQGIRALWPQTQAGAPNVT
jgi:hypothetical protein